MCEQAPDLSPRDTAGALRNVSVSKAVNIDKASAIRGRPSEITANIDVTDLLCSLANNYGGIVKVNPMLLSEEPPIESTAIDEQAEEDELAKLRAGLAELEASQTPDRA
jgi:hypothetical protein